MAHFIHLHIFFIYFREPNLKLISIVFISKQGRKRPLDTPERKIERERAQQMIKKIKIDTYLFVKLNEQIKLGRYSQRASPKKWNKIERDKKVGQKASNQW